MSAWAILSAGVVYFILGGVWFSPFLFGKQWDKAIGFERPRNWKPGAIYYAGPLAGCMIAALATAILVEWARPQTLFSAIGLGLVAGLGYGATLTGVNAILPTLPRAALFAGITGSYHAVGITACAVILYLWS